MHVQVTEQRAGAADELVAQLKKLGCVVSTCLADNAICAAVAPARRCPLDGTLPVDLLVDVRTDSQELTVREFGVICALRAHCPVVFVAPSDDRLPVVPHGLQRQVTVVRKSALLTACADALRTEAQRELHGRCAMST